jgi:hypothetical protein
MYADDMVLLSPTAEGLQEKLNLLNTYCKDWCLKVNTQKTKVIVLMLLGNTLISPSVSIITTLNVLNITDI